VFKHGWTSAEGKAVRARRTTHTAGPVRSFEPPKSAPLDNQWRADGSLLRQLL